MPYVYREARQLENKEKIGDKECVTLIRHFTSAGWTGSWKQGAQVAGNKTIAEGTAVANFVNGKWPGLRHGNHSAFYLGQVSDGIYIIDQWPDKKLISKRFIRRKGKDSRGNFINPTDNADAFFVIE
jgi:hypothetical protein